MTPSKSLSETLDSNPETRAPVQFAVFSMLRQAKPATEFCIRERQLVQLSLLEGCKPYNNPDMAMVSDAPNVEGHLFTLKMLHLVSLSIVEHDWGNLYRDVWMWSAWMCCLDPNNDYTADERAVQGLLCGHLDSLLPNCQTWEDCLWAHLRVKMDRIVENGLRWYARRTKEGRELMQLPHSYWQSELTFENMFANVESFIKDIPGDKAATRHGSNSSRRSLRKSRTNLSISAGNFSLVDGSNSNQPRERRQQSVL